MKTRFFLTLMLLSLYIVLHAQEVFPGGIPGTGGSYNLTFPGSTCAPFNARPIGNNNTAAITKTASYPGPFQTHNWWNSALWNVSYLTATKDLHSDVMHPHPLMLDAESNGLVLRHRNKDYQAGANTSNYFTADQDVRVYLKNKTAASTQVDNYGHWHARMVQETGSGDNLYFTAAAGCPYVFFQKQGSADPMVYGANIRITNSGTNSIGFTINPNPFSYPDVPYSIFFPTGTLLSIDNGVTFINPSTLVAGTSIVYDIQIRLPSGTDYFSVAVLPNSSLAAFTLFTQHAFNFITDTDFSYSYDEATAKVVNLFTATTTAMDGSSNEGTLQALYRHQYLYSTQATSANTGYTYMSPRGSMKLIQSDVFATEMTYYGSLPSLAWANTADSIQLYNLCSNYASTSEISTPSSYTGDMYNVFIMISQAARIAEIAHEVGNYAARNKCLDAAKYHIEDWLSSPDGQNCKIAHYSPTFNYMTCYPDAFNTDIGMHDAHFMYGYLIHGAAIVGSFEQKRFGNINWINKWKPMIDLIVRNINDWNKNCLSSVGDPLNPCFPYLRFFDPYAGHSWAHNYTESQESVSEAVQFAAGAMLWGSITGNTAMRDMGAMLFVNESEAGRQYWYDVDNANVNRAPFAPDYPYNHAGIIYTWGSAYACFFGTDPYQFHGITYWPISGASVWMGANTSGIQRDYSDFLSAYGGNVSGTNAESYWTSEMLGAMALYDASSAHTLFKPAVLNNTSVFDVNAVFKSHRINAWHWISTLDSVGTVDATVQANTAFYSVFKKGDCKHYMVYNPYNQPAKTVSFTDGKSFFVPSDTLIVFRSCPGDVLPVKLLDFKAEKSGAGALITWQTETEENTLFTIEKSEDGKTFEAIATVEGKNGNVNNYSFYDPDRYQPISYYRLIQNEQEEIRYSKIITLTEEDYFQLSEVYPNPAEDEITISLQSGKSTMISYKIMDITGRLITTSGKQETTQLTIDVHDLPTGPYLILLRNETTGESFVRNFCKIE